MPTIWSKTNSNIYAMAIAVYYTEGGGLTLACPIANTGQVGVPYSSSLIASGGTPPYTFAITSGSLPTGLTLNTSTGVISGTPSAAGTFSYTATVTDSVMATAMASCSIVISVPALSLACPIANTGMIGTAYSSSFVAVGGVPPYTFAIISGTLPPGLALNTSTGAITGFPTTVGTYPYTGQVTDSLSTTATANCAIVIMAADGSGSNKCANSGECGGLPTFEVTLDLDADWSREVTLYITQDEPFPFTLRALVVRHSYNPD